MRPGDLLGPGQGNPVGFYRIAKSRWEIGNEGFNDGRNCYGMEHIRGRHRVRSAMEVKNWLWIHLASPSGLDSGYRQGGG